MSAQTLFKGAAQQEFFMFSCDDHPGHGEFLLALTVVDDGVILPHRIGDVKKPVV